MSTIRNDGCTDAVLDFIAGGVPGNRNGESCGNYNAVIGAPRSRDDLSARTVNGIYALQDYLLSIGRPSTAVGRYQIIRSTLETLQDALDLSGNELFTPALQDRLAVALLVDCGYRQWWRGTIDDAEFAHRLSLEWASLPDPKNGGRSHYDGDAAGNHAGTTLAAVYAMLRAARAAKPAAK